MTKRGSFYDAKGGDLGFILASGFVGFCLLDAERLAYVLTKKP
jgi:hypothetical protein